MTDKDKLSLRIELKDTCPSSIQEARWGALLAACEPGDRVIERGPQVRAEDLRGYHSYYEMSETPTITINDPMAAKRQAMQHRRQARRERRREIRGAAEKMMEGS